MIKLVVWDWNGTLIDDSLLRYELGNKIIKKLGHPGITFDNYQEEFSIPVHDFYRKIGISEEMIKENDARLRAEIIGIEYEQRVKDCALRDAAEVILKQLEHESIVNIILSNHPTIEIQQELTRRNIAGYFSVVLGNSDIQAAATMGKKDRLVQYLHENNILPASAIIIGDTDEETIIGTDLAMKTVAITGGTHSEARLRRQQPDLLVHSLREIIPAMKEKKWL